MQYQNLDRVASLTDATTTHRKLGRVWLVGALLLLADCNALDDLNRTGGNSEKGYFSVSPEADLAEGAKLTFKIGDYETVSGSRSGIDLSEPRVLSTEIASIAGSDSDGTIDIKGVKAGETSVEFTAKADDQTIKDAFALHVAKVTSIALSSCSSSPVVARGTEVQVRYVFNETSKRKVLGRGYYPVQLKPEGAGSLDKSASNEKYLSLAISDSAPSEFTLRSSLSSDGTALKFIVVDDSEIDGVSVLSPTSTARGTSFTVDLKPLVNGRPLCSRMRRVLKSLNPNACSIAGAINGELDTTDDSASVSLDAVDACQLLLEFPEVHQSFILGEIIVTEPADSDGHHSLDFDD